jgi:phage terminase large subunit-like protein
MGDSEALKKKRLLKQRKLELLKEREQMKMDLPHLYGPKFYQWQKDYFESKNRVNLICSANQIGKSSAAIRRTIANCTDPKRWEEIYESTPRQFWYLYPDIATLRREWSSKWVAEYMPRGKMKSHPQYGWKAVMEREAPTVVHFNSGIDLYFLTYTKDLSSIQASTVHEITSDEELPVNFYDELILRLAVTNGVFNMVCTPTLNQPFWKRAMESSDVLPNAFKRQVSMYDCLTYFDGSPSKVFTVEKIKNVEEKCRSEAERQRRVWGKFITEEGREYFAYDPERNRCQRAGTNGWHVHVGVDYGSGGTDGHPSAIVFVKVRPDYKKGVVHKAWRGDGVKTTCGDLFNKYVDMLGNDLPVRRVYDFAAADFHAIAERNGETFQRANKSKSLGREVLNTLFKFGMLDIYEGDIELDKLSGELLTVMTDSKANVNDLSDALRYCVVDIPWDFESIRDNNEDPDKKMAPVKLTPEQLMAEQVSLRRGEGSLYFKDEELVQGGDLSEEFDYWNEEYGG